MNQSKTGLYFYIINRNKALFLCWIFSVVLFSCSKKEPNSVRQTTGKINIISVIIDDQLWNGEIGDSIRNKFASPVIGLPEEEPRFTIKQYPVKLLEGFATNSRAIIVVKKGAKSQFKIIKNQYAIPQKVFHISGETVSDIVTIFEEQSSQIIQLIEEGEIAESQRNNRKSLLNSNRIAQRFHAQIQIPSDFEYVLQKPNFIWIKKKIMSGSASLLVYQIPLNKAITLRSILKMRDSIGTYIQGTEPNTPMVTEANYSPYFFKTHIAGIPVYETRGTWQLQNDYMSGPFLNYVIPDINNKRILVLEGFCYSPSKEKRDVMHELKAIMHSIQIKSAPHKNQKHAFRMEN